MTSGLLGATAAVVFFVAGLEWRYCGFLLGIAALGVTIAAWFLPMIRASGGLAAYFGALFSLWRMVPSRDTVFNSSPATSMARAAVIVFIYFLCFGAASLAPLGASLSSVPADKSKRLFTAVWIVPALCFFTFIFLKLVNSGYLLLVAAPACIWLGCWTADWYEHGPWPKSIKLSITAICALANVLIFLAFPAYCSYRSVRHFEAELQTTVTALPQVGTPENLLIVSFDNHSLGYRHAGYYLPGYLTLEYPESNLLEGPRIFAMQGRDTFLLSGLPDAPFARFVLFPLPAGNADYALYMDKIKKLLPGKDLSSMDLGGHQFVTAPMADLPLLFCSPTMELGVDIAQLNVVNLRNVPPTPANYAQRSGRAGRGGQPALVYTYSAMRLVHHGHFQLVVGGALVPLVLLLLLRCLDSPSASRAVVLSLSLAALTLTASYYGAMMGVIVAIVATGWVLAQRPQAVRPVVGALAVAAIVALALIAPFGVRYLRLETALRTSRTSLRPGAAVVCSRMSRSSRRGRFRAAGSSRIDSSRDSSDSPLVS